MGDKIAGYIMVGTNEKGEVVINLDKDRNGIGHLIFSVNQAKNFAKILLKKAEDIEQQKEK